MVIDSVEKYKQTADVVIRKCEAFASLLALSAH